MHRYALGSHLVSTFIHILGLPHVHKPIELHRILSPQVFHDPMSPYDTSPTTTRISKNFISCTLHPPPHNLHFPYPHHLQIFAVLFQRSCAVTGDTIASRALNQLISILSFSHYANVRQNSHCCDNCPLCCSHPRLQLPNYAQHERRLRLLLRIGLHRLLLHRTNGIDIWGAQGFSL